MLTPTQQPMQTIVIKLRKHHKQNWNFFPRRIATMPKQRNPPNLRRSVYRATLDLKICWSVAHNEWLRRHQNRHSANDSYYTPARTSQTHLGIKNNFSSINLTPICKKFAGSFQTIRRIVKMEPMPAQADTASKFTAKTMHVKVKITSEFIQFSFL